MGRHGKASRRHVLLAAGSPLAVVAAFAAASAPSGSASPTLATTVKAADGPQFPLAPFAADPRVIPLYRDVVTSQHHRRPPPATSHERHLPKKLVVFDSQIPRPALAAYVNAARMTDRAEPTCGIKWQVIAGIGYIESDHAASGGSGNPGWNGEASPHILGPVLDGSHGVGAIPDTDDGRLDGNTVWDRAVGPMQFLPSTWAIYAADGNGDGVKDPEQIDDATLAAAHYLCAAATELGQNDNLVRAVYSYNHSYAYVKAVLTVAAHYMNINPNKLGIGSLPSDHKRRHHKGRKRRKHIGRTTPPSPTSSPGGGPTRSPAPSPSSGPHTSSPAPRPTSIPTVSPPPTSIPTAPLPTPSTIPTIS